MAKSVEGARTSASVFVRQATGLVRELSWLDTFIMVFAILNIPLGLAEVSAFATGASAYPAANMPLAFVLSAPAMLTIGMVYALFTAAMPRSGGDYVWASRVLHPSIGFGVNFFVTFILLSSAGLNSLLMATWFLPPVFHILGLDNVAAFCADTTGYGAVTVGTIVTLLLLGVFLLGMRRVRQIMFGLFAFIMLGTIFWLILLFALAAQRFRGPVQRQSGQCSLSGRACFSREERLSDTAERSLLQHLPGRHLRLPELQRLPELRLLQRRNQTGALVRRASDVSSPRLRSRWLQSGYARHLSLLWAEFHWLTCHKRPCLSQRQQVTFPGGYAFARPVCDG